MRPEQADPPDSPNLLERLKDHSVLSRAVRWGVFVWAAIGTLLLGGVAVWALAQIRDVFPPLVLALIVIYLLNPFVSRMERVGVGRLVGSCFAYTVFFSFVAVALLFLVPVLVGQAQDFVRDAPRTFERLEDVATRVELSVERRIGREFDAGEWLNGDFVSNALSSAGRLLRGTVHTVALLVIGLFVGFYLLIDLPRLRRAALHVIPPHRRPEAQHVAAAMSRAMGGFFRGQLLVALAVGVLSAFALWIVGIPYWLVVGLIAGLFNLIPLIGPWVGAVPGILLAAAFRPPITMLWVALALAIVQQIDNHFISPNVMRWTVRLHPVTVIISLLAGAAVLGFWGLLLAVPAVAAVKVVVAHLWRTRVPWGHEVFSEVPPAVDVGAGDRLPPPAPSG